MHKRASVSMSGGKGVRGKGRVRGRRRLPAREPDAAFIPGP